MKTRIYLIFLIAMLTSLSASAQSWKAFDGNNVVFYIDTESIVKRGDLASARARISTNTQVIVFEIDCERKIVTLTTTSGTLIQDPFTVNSGGAYYSMGDNICANRLMRIFR